MSIATPATAGSASMAAGRMCSGRSAASLPVAVAVSPKEIQQILRSSTGYNTIFNLAVNGGETTPVMVASGPVLVTPAAIMATAVPCPRTSRREEPAT